MFCLVALGGYYQSSQFAHMKLFIQMWQGSGFTNLWYRWDLWIMKLKFLFQQLHPGPRPLSQSDAWVGGFPSKRNGKGQRSWRRHVNSKIWNKEARRHTLSWDSCVSFEKYGAVKNKKSSLAFTDLAWIHYIYIYTNESKFSPRYISHTVLGDTSGASALELVMHWKMCCLSRISAGAT